MYLKRHAVRRGSKRYVYLRLVEAFRDAQRRVRHRVLATLGREDELKASGQLDQLAAAFARVDPPRIGARREVGPLLLVRYVLEQLDLVQLIERHVPQRGRAELSVGEVVAALVANRLCAPAPLYDIAGWASGAAVQELLGVPGMLLNDDRLGRALEAFAPVAEAVRGAAALAAIDRFGVDAARLHLDLTTVRVAGAYEGSALVKKGWGADRHVRRQVRVLQAVNRQGIPLYVRPHPGDAAELNCIGLALERLAQLLGPGLLICADSALGHIKNLCAANRARLRFIVPLRADTGFAERFLEEVGHQAMHPLGYVSRRDRSRSPRQRPQYRGALRGFDIIDPETAEHHGFRVVYVWSSEEAQSVREARERALLKAEKSLAMLQRSCARGRYIREELDSKLASSVFPSIQELLVISIGSKAGRPTIRWHRNAAALRKLARTDGIYALATNLRGRISATRILRLYKDQYRVELRHRDAKQTLRVRPIFLHNDDRIQALTSVVGLALLVFGLIEMCVRRALGPDQLLDHLLPEGRPGLPTGRSILAAFQGLEMTYTQDGPILDPLTPTQRRILQLLKLTPPWPERAKHSLPMCGKRG
jgi:hypothetical protein